MGLVLKVLYFVLKSSKLHLMRRLLGFEGSSEVGLHLGVLKGFGLKEFL